MSCVSSSSYKGNDLIRESMLKKRGEAMFFLSLVPDDYLVGVHQGQELFIHSLWDGYTETQRNYLGRLFAIPASVDYLLKPQWGMMTAKTREAITRGFQENIKRAINTVAECEVEHA